MTFYDRNRFKDVYLNFNICPYGYGKTYYEMNKSWKDLKKRIKQILDSEQESRINKINGIIGILEHYKAVYLTSKGDGNSDGKQNK